MNAPLTEHGKCRMEGTMGNSTETTAATCGLTKPAIRLQVITFAKNEGLKVKADKCGVFAHNPKTPWFDAFDNWAQAYDYFLSHSRARQSGGPRAPWEGAAA